MIGYDYVTQDSAESNLDIDSRYNCPWVSEKRNANISNFNGSENMYAFVRRTILRMAPWHKWSDIVD